MDQEEDARETSARATVFSMGERSGCYLWVQTPQEVAMYLRWVLTRGAYTKERNDRAHQTARSPSS